MDLRLETWRARVGTSFELAAPGTPPFAVALTACEPGAPAGERTAFSLLFHAPGGELVPQQICTLSDGERSIELFLVPLGPDERGMRYEAVIS